MAQEVDGNLIYQLVLLSVFIFRVETNKTCSIVLITKNCRKQLNDRKLFFSGEM